MPSRVKSDRVSVGVWCPAAGGMAFTVETTFGPLEYSYSDVSHTVYSWDGNRVASGVGDIEQARQAVLRHVRWLAGRLFRACNVSLG